MPCFFTAFGFLHYHCHRLRIPFLSERIKYNHYNGRYANIYFWRTKEQHEIDYIEECDAYNYAVIGRSNLIAFLFDRLKIQIYGL